MKSIYLTDKNFKVLDKKLDSIETEINRILSMPVIDWKKLDLYSSRLNVITAKLQNTIEFAETFRLGES